MTPEAPLQLLPWSNSDLEILLHDLIDHGVETPKADCKAEIDTSTNEGKADHFTATPQVGVLREPLSGILGRGSGQENCYTSGRWHRSL